jgi:gamma-carbonic anhydrase
VSSVEPLSATTILRTGGRGRSASTRGSERSSLRAGITTAISHRRFLDTGGFYAMLSPPAPTGRRSVSMPIHPYQGVLPRLGARVFIAPGAYVVGDVELGDDVSFWFHTVARGDVNSIRIGARTNIQDLTMVHVMRETYPTVIGDNVTVGHRAVVHGCTIEDRCLIGIGAILLNGCRIGTGSIVAAGTLVPEGFVVPPGSMVVGLPGKVRRQLTPEEDASIKWYADNYVRYRLDFQSEHTPV